MPLCDSRLPLSGRKDPRLTFMSPSVENLDETRRYPPFAFAFAFAALGTAGDEDGVLAWVASLTFKSGEKEKCNVQSVSLITET